jgi:hypothetical protein
MLKGWELGVGGWNSMITPTGLTRAIRFAPGSGT